MILRFIPRLTKWQSRAGCSQLLTARPPFLQENKREKNNSGSLQVGHVEQPEQSPQHKCHRPWCLLWTEPLPVTQCHISSFPPLILNVFTASCLFKQAPHSHTFSGEQIELLLFYLLHTFTEHFLSSNHFCAIYLIICTAVISLCDLCWCLLWLAVMKQKSSHCSSGMP